MVPIIICSFLAVAISYERLISYKRAKIDTRRFLERILRLLREERDSEAYEISRSTPGPVAKVVEVGLLRKDQSLNELEDSMREIGSFEIARLEKYLPILGTIAQITPLLGLLGTVTGMIEVFMRIENLGGNVIASDLAGGIWVALITTAAGLTVAIPTIVVYNFFTRTADTFIGEINRASTELIEHLRSRKTGFKYQE